MNIDAHAHLFPQSAVKAVAQGGEWHGSRVSLDAHGVPVVETAGRRQVMGSPRHSEAPAVRLGRMDDLQVDMQLVSLLPPLYRYETPAETAVPAARAVNDELADMVARWPRRYGGLATLPLQDVDASLVELERSMGELGLQGIAVGTHVNGLDWDAPSLFPVLQAAEAAKALVLVHPANPRGPDTYKRYYLNNLVGNPHETTLAIGTFIFGAVLERLPRLRVCFVHGGGYVAAAIGRFGRGHQVRPECAGISREPATYLRQCYFDTLTHDTGGLRALIETVGADRVVMGSDYPADMGDDDPVATVASCDWLTAAERNAIAGGTIAAALGITDN